MIMKKKSVYFVYIIIFVIDLNLTIQSQTYIPFPEKNAQWTEQNGIYEGFPPQTWSSLYITETDTFLLNNSYTNIYEYYLNPNTFDTIRELFASIRQDTLNKKVFIIRHYVSENTERLLLDFNIDVGDTVCLDAYYWDLFPEATDSIFIVDSISKITLYNSEPRDIYYLSNHDGDFFPVVQNVLIEGVGSIINPFGPTTDLLKKKNNVARELCCPEYLLCLSVKEEPIYVFNDSTDCGKLSVWTSIDDLNEIAVILYPNPVVDFLQLEVSPPSTHEKLLIINDMFGKMIITKRFFENKILLDLSNLKPGFYLSRLLYEKEITTHKIIVLH